MKLTHRYDCYLELNEYLSHEYHCELTKELDDLAGFDKKMIEEKGYNTITMMIVVNNERICKLEKGNQLDKPLIKVQYK